MTNPGFKVSGTYIDNQVLSSWRHTLSQVGLYLEVNLWGDIPYVQDSTSSLNKGKGEHMHR